MTRKEAENKKAKAILRNSYIDYRSSGKHRDNLRILWN